MTAATVTVGTEGTVPDMTVSLSQLERVASFKDSEGVEIFLMTSQEDLLSKFRAGQVLDVSILHNSPLSFSDNLSANPAGPASFTVKAEELATFIEHQGTIQKALDEGSYVYEGDSVGFLSFLRSGLIPKSLLVDKKGKGAN